MPFRKAKAQQAFAKVAIYGATGRGKTLTTLLCAEYLAKRDAKRIAYVDTERGTDFFVTSIPERICHPEAFDIDIIYERAVSNIMKDLQSLNSQTHSVIVIDSITHIWETCIESHRGRYTSAGTIPIHAWGNIKKPYKKLMQWLVNCPFHVFILGREGYEYDTDDKGEMKRVGTKMKAEGETAYEPHILINLHTVDGHITAHAEKDRTSVLFGKPLQLWPTPLGKETTHTADTLMAPLVPLLNGSKQAVTQSTEQAGRIDAEAQIEDEAAKNKKSSELLEEYKAKLSLCKSIDDLKALNKPIVEAKKSMNSEDTAKLKEAYLERESKF